MFGGSCIHLILHLEHDGDEFSAVIGRLAENEVTLTSRPCVVILFKVCIRESSHSDGIELVLAVLLETLSHHLG